MPRSRTPGADIPHSWDISSWPESVYPNSPSRGRYLIRKHKDDLLREGALCRVGKELVCIGARYARWLEKQAANVPDYEIAPNREPRQGEAPQC